MRTVKSGIHRTGSSLGVRVTVNILVFVWRLFRCRKLSSWEGAQAFSWCGEAHHTTPHGGDTEWMLATFQPADGLVASILEASFPHDLFSAYLKSTLLSTIRLYHRPPFSLPCVLLVRFFCHISEPKTDLLSSKSLGTHSLDTESKVLSLLGLGTISTLKIYQRFCFCR